MNWSQLIRDLIEDGLTQSQIAEKIDCGQSYISEILNNKKGSRFSFEKGQALVHLHAERFQTQTTNA